LLIVAPDYVIIYSPITIRQLADNKGYAYEVGGERMRLSFVFAGSLLFIATVSPAGQPSLKASNELFLNRLAVQARCENELFRAAQAKEATEGPEYQVFRMVASAFGRKEIPHLYIAEEGNNAAYIAGSSLVDGKGKIVISRRFIELLASTLALEGVLAHEMGHLVSDDGICGCDQWILRDPMQELAADALAAKTVGYHPVRALFLRIKEAQGGLSMDVDIRLQAIDELERREKNQTSSVAASSFGVIELHPYNK
jgi:Zn-dependent protease with chaperone function